VKKLKVKRFIQDPSHCSIAATACVGNYWDENVNYEKIKKIARKTIRRDLSEGLDTGEISRLLNVVGFQKITVISANMFFLDFTWRRLSKKNLIKNLKVAKTKVNIDYRGQCSAICKFLETDQFDNKLIIDYNFGKYIRDSLNRNIPIIITLNWTMFFKQPKSDFIKNTVDTFRGECEEHALVIHGYNRKNVNICDSHHQYYKYNLKKYRKGFYSISWENLMSCMCNQDVIIAENYCI